MTWLNLLIGAGLLIAALANLLTVTVVGVALTLGGVLNLIDGWRRQIRAWIFYAVCWAFAYIGVHIVIAARDPQFFSYWAAGWTLGFVALAGLAIWRFGGVWLDATIVVSAAPEFDVDGFLNSHPDGPLAFNLLFLLPLWRRMGRSFFSFLRFVFMVALLIGLYFLFFPPSMNWRMFWVIAIAFAAYVVSNRTPFNWDKWNSVSLLVVMIGLVVSLTSPWWRSYTLPIYKNVIAPTTSNNAVVTRDTTVWREGSIGAETFLANTAVLIVDSTPHRNDELGLDVLHVRRARVLNNPKRGFLPDVYLVIPDDIERATLSGNSPDFQWGAVWAFIKSEEGVALVGLILFAIIMTPVIKRKISAIGSTTPSPVRGATATTTAPTTPAPVAGNGGGGAFPWKIVFGTIVAAAVVGLLILIAVRLGDQTAHAQQQSWVNPLPLPNSAPAAPAPPSPTTGGVRLPTPAPSVISLGDGKWEVILPANMELHTGIRVTADQNVVFSGWTGSVKLNPGDSYTNPPSGGFPTAAMKYKTSSGDIQILPRESWVLPEAWTGALLARLEGQDYTDVGDRVSNSFQVASDGEVILSIGCLRDERNNASGSFHGTIEIQ